MKLRKKRNFFFGAALTGLFLVGFQAASASQVKAPVMEELDPSASDCSDRSYLPKLRELILGAQKTLDIAAENFSLSDLPDDPVAHLIEDLIVSQKKGIRVRIFMNTFSEFPEQIPLFLREDVLYRMRREGIEIHFVNPNYNLRDRLVIVDGESVLEGGIPWNKADLERGLGSAVLVHSSQLADKKRIRLEFLPLWDVEKHKIEFMEGSVAVPVYLLREIRYFPSMVSHDDGDAMKIYMKLIRLFNQVQDVHLTAGFEELGAEIPAADYFEKHAVQYQAEQALERLAAEYNLIEIEKKASDRFMIRMIFPQHEEPVIRVPIALFQENYVKELTPSAIFAYLVILYRAQITGEAPVWLGSERNVEQDFPITSNQFRNGATELKKRNLIEIFPFKLQQGYKTASILEYRYLINPILTLSERLEMWTRLRDQFGEDNLKQSRSMAEFLGEPEDPKVLATYLDLMKHFKAQDVMSFTERLSGLPPESTPGLLGYLRTQLEHETQKNAQLATS